MGPEARAQVLLGRVLPLSDGLKESGAVLVQGERIGEVAASLDELGAEGRRVLDFGDRTILPGFVDVHAHAEVACVAERTAVDCRTPEHRTIEDVLEELREALPRAEDGWLIGRGNFFFDQKLEDRRMPTRADLDRLGGDVAIALRAGGHTTVLNSRAMERVNIEELMSMEQGMMGAAVVELDSGGQPTGVVSELDRALPLPDPDPETLKGWIEAELPRIFTAHGATTVGEISETLDGVTSMQELAAGGRLASRIQMYLWAPGTMSIDEACDWRSQGIEEVGDRFGIRGLKLFADGGYTSQNAAVKSPFLSHGGKGKLNLTPDEVVEARRKADAAGLQLAVHTNGERAQELVCGALASMGLPDDALPTRLEHAGNLVTEEATMEAWDKAAVALVPQPVFIYAIGDFLPAYLGEHAERGRFPFRTILDRGWELNGSSDVHLGSEPMLTSPLFGISCYVTREAYLGRPIEPEQAITLAEALRAYTIGGARLLGVDDRLGTLEAGKLADMVVLDRDITKVAEGDIRDVRVDHVFVGGELGHSRPGAAPFRSSDG
jgi:predicted amidohydrolase YtcJ